MDNRQLTVIGVTGLVALLIVLFLFQSREAPKFQDDGKVEFNTTPGSQNTPQVTELMGQDIMVGTGSAVAAGDMVSVHYLGSFLDGKKFDSSYDRNQPFEVKAGAGQVIPGFDRALIGMKVGGKRKVIIPADLAYGAQGSGAIPPNTPIQFEIELLEIKPEQPFTEPPHEPTSAETPTPSPLV